MERRWFEDELLEDANELNLVVIYIVHSFKNECNRGSIIIK